MSATPTTMEPGSYDNLDALQEDVYRRILNDACLACVGVHQFTPGISESEAEAIVALDKPRNGKYGAAIVVHPLFITGTPGQSMVEAGFVVQILERPELNRKSKGTRLSSARIAQKLCALMDCGSFVPNGGAVKLRSRRPFTRESYAPDTDRACLSLSLHFEACYVKEADGQCLRPEIECRDIGGGEFLLVPTAGGEPIPDDKKVLWTTDGSYPLLDDPDGRTMEMDPAGERVKEPIKIRALLIHPTDPHQQSSQVIEKCLPEPD